MIRPHLLIIGPLVGKNPGFNPTLGEILAGLLADSGYPVSAASSVRNRYLRFGHILYSILAKSKQFELSIIQVYGRNSFIVEDAASWLCTVLGMKVILHLHGGSLPEFFERHPAWSHRVLNRAKAIVVPSAYLAGALSKLGYSSTIIPNPLNLSDYPYRMRKRVRPRILWMRAFHENYNPEMAIRVLTRLEELIPDAELVMAGQDKGSLPKMRKLAQELGIGKRVFFPGVMDKDAKQLESNKSDIFINTSRIDNTPVSILEAFAFGMPVVSTNVGGISVFLKDRENAILVDSNSIEEMVQAILEIIRDPQIASHLSQNGRILAEASDWNRLEKSWSNILNSL